MLRINALCSLVALSLVACGGESTPQPETPAQSIPPAEEPTGATTPGIGAATTDASQVTSGPADPSATAASTAPPPAPPPTEAQIALVAELANKSEVEQAKVAQTKAKNARVKKFANMMVNDHGKAVQEQQKLLTKLGIKTEESSLSAQLSTDSQTQLASLKEADAANFDRAYMDAQVDAHSKVLDALDTQLIPNAKNEELRALLTKMRGTVEHHLKEARDIQQSLLASGTGTTGSASGAAGTGTGASKSGAGTMGGTGTSGSGTGVGTGAGGTKAPGAK